MIEINLNRQYIYQNTLFDRKKSLMRLFQHADDGPTRADRDSP